MAIDIMADMVNADCAYRMAGCFLLCLSPVECIHVSWSFNERRIVCL